MVRPFENRTKNHVRLPIGPDFGVQYSDHNCIFFHFFSFTCPRCFWLSSRTTTLPTTVRPLRAFTLSSLCSALTSSTGFTWRGTTPSGSPKLQVRIFTFFMHRHRYSTDIQWLLDQGLDLPPKMCETL